MTKKFTDKALAGYFDDLLHESPEPSAAEKGGVVSEARLTPEPHEQTAASTEQQLVELEEQKRVRLQKLLSQQALVEPPKVETATDTVVETELKTEVKAAEAPIEVEKVIEVEARQEAQVAVATIEAEDAQLSDALLVWAENGRPVWAQSAFDVLLFEVHGLSLAVPLVALGQIIPLDKKLTRLHKQSDWLLGILTSSAGDIRTINTALFVMPERYQESFKDTAKFVVTIDGLPWGLAVDSVKQPVSLQPDDVKWRTERSKRPWLAGTVKSHMCALIDIPQMANLLEDSETPLKR